MREFLLNAELWTMIAAPIACVGLVATWAGVSPQHAYMRLVVPLAFVFPLLLIPAYEPFVLFVAQSLTVVAGLQLLKWRQARGGLANSDKATNPSFIAYTRFSLKSLLSMTIVVAVAALAYSRLPEYEWQAWAELLITGAWLGFVTLLAAWLSYGKPAPWLRVLVSLACIALLPALLKAASDAALGYNHWPDNWIQVPVDYTFEQSLGFDLGQLCETFRSKWMSAALIFVMTSILISFRKTGLQLPLTEVSATDALAVPNKHRWPMPVAVAMSACLFLPATFVWFQLMRLEPIPVTLLPVPNGHDDLVAARKLMIDCQLNSRCMGLELAPVLSSALKIAGSAPFDRAHLGLSRKSRFAIEYGATTELEHVFDAVSVYRNIADALLIRFTLAKYEKRYQDAAADCVDAIRLTDALRRGGILAHARVTCSWWASEWLYQNRHLLSGPQCIEIARQLQQLDAEREPFADIYNRDRAWQQRITGWNGHFLQILEDNRGRLRKFELERFNVDVASDRLVLTELAMEAYHANNRTFPTKLDDLIPDYLTSVPADPFDPTGGPLRFSSQNEKRFCYSLGLNQKDDHGEPSERGQYRNAQEGDIRCDVRFAPQQDQE